MQEIEIEGVREMARKRMIDPGIWSSEDFSKLTSFSKLVFIGLFSLADDEGRGKANPSYLKSMLFPYEEGIRSADIKKTLQEIASTMSVIFYTHDEKEYYALKSWGRFQTINRPSPSDIPAPTSDSVSTHRGLSEDSVSAHGGVMTKRKEEEKEEKGKEEKGKEEARAPGIPYQKIVNLYNELCPKLNRCMKVSDARERAVKARYSSGYTLEDFEKLFRLAGESRFLNGGNERNWRADFDWLVRDANMAKVLEGKYTDQERSPTKEQAEQKEDWGLKDVIRC